MTQSDTAPLTRKPLSVAWEGIAGRLDAARLQHLPPPARQTEKRRRSYVRQMLAAATIAAGAILAVAAVMMLGAL